MPYVARRPTDAQRLFTVVHKLQYQCNMLKALDLCRGNSYFMSSTRPPISNC
jgi:hypothetical protein